jgi:hypothetical protein
MDTLTVVWREREAEISVNTLHLLSTADLGKFALLQVGQKLSHV